MPKSPVILHLRQGILFALLTGQISDYISKRFEDTLPHRVHILTLETSYYVLRSSFKLYIHVLKERDILIMRYLLRVWGDVFNVIFAPRKNEKLVSANSLYQAPQLLKVFPCKSAFSFPLRFSCAINLDGHSAHKSPFSMFLFFSPIQTARNKIHNFYQQLMSESVDLWRNGKFTSSDSLSAPSHQEHFVK